MIRGSVAKLSSRMGARGVARGSGRRANPKASIGAAGKARGAANKAGLKKGKTTIDRACWSELTAAVLVGRNLSALGGSSAGFKVMKLTAPTGGGAAMELLFAADDDDGT